MHVGITGGIGSGKTTVCKIFESLNIPVYYADDRAKQLMIEDEKLVQAIQATFGLESYDEKGQLNRAYLSGIVFNDPKKLQQLNQLVHPVVHQDGLKWQKKQEDAAYTLKEAALLYESGSFRTLDKMICVYAPKKIRLERVMQRDNTTEKAVLARMNKQLSEVDKMTLSDFIITNDGRTALIAQVLHLHRTLTQKT